MKFITVMHDCISTIGSYRKSSIKPPLSNKPPRLFRGGKLISPPFPSLYYQEDKNTSLFFLLHFNVDDRFIVVFSLDMD